MPPISINDLCNNDNTAASQKQSSTNNQNMSSTSNEAFPQSQADSQAGAANPLSSNEHFITRVSNFPIVNTALRAYENSKASSSVVKYSAETVESSVKTIWGPVASRLEPRLERLDDFACRQLDKLEKTYSSYTETPNQNFTETSELRRRKHSNNPDCEKNPEFIELPQSRWKKVVVNAGAGVAFVSEESMKRLRYCLQWLQYASAHLSRQTHAIHSYIQELCQANREIVHRNTKHANFINTIKHEIVETLRQVVNVIGRYAGSCLPGEACNRASLNVPTLDNDSVSATSCSSAISTPIGNNQTSNGIPADEAIQRLLLLANESSQLVYNVKSIFKETVERADTWTDAISGLKKFAHSYGVSGSPSTQLIQETRNLELPPISVDETSEQNIASEGEMEVDSA